MNILVAPSSFKESLDAPQVAKNIGIGLQKASSQYNVTELPLADGGSGTVAVLTAAYKGEYVTCRVCGPLGTAVNAVYGWVPQRRLAIIELAQAAGLALVPPDKRNPCVTTTHGVGELIVDAANRGSKRIILGVGDSATIDCGVGALTRLGIQYVDKHSCAVAPSCHGLIALRRIDDSHRLSWIKSIDFTVAADVQNVLTGTKGAIMYARQKGATRAMIPVITRALRNFKKVVLMQYNIDVDTIPGTGAAGGIPAAFCAVLGARLEQGFERIKAAVKLEQAVKRADVVITGEGRIDRQSRYGKVVGGVIELCNLCDKPVIIIAGYIRRNALPARRRRIVASYSLVSKRVSRLYAVRNTDVLLQQAGWKCGQSLKSMSLP